MKLLCVGKKKKKSLCGKKWMSHNVHSFWLTHYLSGFSPCMSRSLFSPMWITAITHMPVVVVIVCLGQSKYIWCKEFRGWDFIMGCPSLLAWPSTSILWVAWGLFVLKKNVYKWLTNNIYVWIYEVWSPEYEAVNKLVGVCPCSFFHKVHHFI